MGDFCNRSLAIYLLKIRVVLMVKLILASFIKSNFVHILGSQVVGVDLVYLCILMT